MAAAEVKEKVLFLSQEIVQKSVGFSLDVGKNSCVYLLVCLFVGCLVCWSFSGLCSIAAYSAILLYH